jgi:hypothetical protein
MLSQCSPPETRWVQKSWKTNTEMNGWAQAV